MVTEFQREESSSGGFKRVQKCFPRSVAKQGLVTTCQKTGMKVLVRGVKLRKSKQLLKLPRISMPAYFKWITGKPNPRSSTHLMCMLWLSGSSSQSFQTHRKPSRRRGSFRIGQDRVLVVVFAQLSSVNPRVLLGVVEVATWRTHKLPKNFADADAALRFDLRRFTTDAAVYERNTTETIQATNSSAQKHPSSAHKSLVLAGHSGVSTKWKQHVPVKLRTCAYGLVALRWNWSCPPRKKQKGLE